MEEVANKGNDHGPEEEEKKKGTKWVPILLNGVAMVIGSIASPLMSRLYFLHGGSRKWVASWLLNAGFPILLIPISILLLRNRSQKKPITLIKPKLLMAGVSLGLLIGLDNFMYSLGLSYLPVSTSSLIFATQLAFIAIFSFVIVRQRFTAYSINAIVSMTMGTVILAVHKRGDRPPNVSDGEYLLGFFVTLGGAALLGFILPCTEFAYTKLSKSKVITYELVLQFQLILSSTATAVCALGMLINKDFQAIPREASAYGLGETKYYVVLVSLAITSQLLFIGSQGIIFDTSSFCAGVLAATLLPVTEVSSVIAYKERFTAEKGLALALSLWGFVSYFYGEYEKSKSQNMAPSSANNSV